MFKIASDARVYGPELVSATLYALDESTNRATLSWPNAQGIGVARDGCVRLVSHYGDFHIYVPEGVYSLFIGRSLVNVLMSR